MMDNKGSGLVLPELGWPWLALTGTSKDIEDGHPPSFLYFLYLPLLICVLDARPSG